MCIWFLLRKKGHFLCLVWFVSTSAISRQLVRTFVALMAYVRFDVLLQKKRNEEKRFRIVYILTNSTNWKLFRKLSSFSKSVLFFTGPPLASLQFFFFQPWIHFVMQFIVNSESVLIRTLLTFCSFRTSNASMQAWISAVLFVARPIAGFETFLKKDVISWSEIRTLNHLQVMIWAKPDPNSSFCVWFSVVLARSVRINDGTTVYSLKIAFKSLRRTFARCRAQCTFDRTVCIVFALTKKILMHILYK